MMLHALVTELAQTGVEVVTTRDGRLPELDLPAQVHRIDTAGDFESAWRHCLAASDAVWPVAPETGGILQDITTRVVRRGRTLLGSRPSAIRVAASKRATAEYLAAAGLPAAPVHSLAAIEQEPDRTWVVKPDDGVGAIGVRAVHGDAAWRRVQAGLDPHRTYVAQPFLCGKPVSLCLLCRDGAARVLSRNLQHVAIADDAFTLLGCTVNAPQLQDPAYDELAGRIAAALPGLWGLVGVDLIVTAQTAWIVDLNPRLTTCCAALHSSTGINPAALVLDLVHRPLPRGPLCPTAVAVDISLEVLDVA